MNQFELPDPVNRLVETVNHGDTDSFLDFFTSDGVVDDSGRHFVGRDSIR
jgi:hypothetical protein